MIDVDFKIMLYLPGIVTLETSEKSVKKKNVLHVIQHFLWYSAE